MRRRFLLAHKCSKRILDFVFPQFCVICGTPVSSYSFVYPVCITCHSELGFKPCKEVVERYPFYHMGLYDEGLKVLIQEMKYGPFEDMGRYLAKRFYRLWARSGAFDGVDALVPIPVDFKRFWKRGFNQSAVIARTMGLLAHIPVEEGVLHKIRSTEPQMSLNREDRLVNLAGAFKAKPQRLDAVKTIALIDDVLTTGSTVLECIDSLKSCYPHLRVRVMTMARA